MTLHSYQPDAGDIDIDASLDVINELRRHGAADVDQLKVRGWMKPGTALCLLIDRSGSMGGRPLATSAVAAAAVAVRNPGDYSVVVFGSDVVVAKSQDVHKDAQTVINAVLRLRGFGTTNLSAALMAAHQQLQRSRADRKITMLLSDCRATVIGDVLGAALTLDELVILAPDGDDSEARQLGMTVGASVTTVRGPSDIPDAFARVFD
jgi:Mg-chelatase subunit ChlD